MENYSMHLPSYSIGSKVYDKIPEICEPYGTKVIAIGGHKAINAAKDKIIKACEKSNLEILDFIWYGGEATYENVEELMKNPLVQQADMIFAIGGGNLLTQANVLELKRTNRFFLSRLLHLTVQRVQVFQLCTILTEDLRNHFSLQHHRYMHLLIQRFWFTHHHVICGQEWVILMQNILKALCLQEVKR